MVYVMLYKSKAHSEDVLPTVWFSTDREHYISQVNAIADSHYNDLIHAFAVDTESGTRLGYDDNELGRCGFGVHMIREEDKTVIVKGKYI